MDATNPAYVKSSGASPARASGQSALGELPV